MQHSDFLLFMGVITVETLFVSENSNPILSVNGYLVTVSFTPDFNEDLVEQLKRILVSSYSEKNVDVEFAISAKKQYNVGGKTSVP